MCEYTRDTKRTRVAVKRLKQLFNKNTGRGRNYNGPKVAKFLVG